MRRKVQFARDGGERRLTCRRVEAERELPLILVRAMRMKMVGQDQAEHPVTKKLKAFIAAAL